MTKYRGVMIALHWIVALIVIFSLVVGKLWLAPLANAEPFKLTLLSGHMISGLLVLALMVWRVIARLRGPNPAPVQSGSALIDFVAKVTHAALYLLVIAMGISGMVLSQTAGLPGIVFGGVGELPESFASFPAKAVHEMLSGLLIALILLHLVAAIWHQVVKRDNLMARMSFRG